MTKHQEPGAKNEAQTVECRAWLLVDEEGKYCVYGDRGGWGERGEAPVESSRDDVSEFFRDALHGSPMGRAVACYELAITVPRPACVQISVNVAELQQKFNATAATAFLRWEEPKAEEVKAESQEPEASPAEPPVESPPPPEPPPALRATHVRLREWLRDVKDGAASASEAALKLGIDSDTVIDLAACWPDWFERRKQGRGWSIRLTEEGRSPD